MSVLSLFIKPVIVIAIATVGFGAAQGYIADKAEATPVTISNPDPIAATIAQDSERTGMMSPIYPTIKYTAAQLAMPTAIPSRMKKPARIAVRRANTMPMQIAYIPDRH